MKKLFILCFVSVISLCAHEKICETKLDQINGCVLKEYENGVLVLEEPYLNGKINGMVKIYYSENGTLKGEYPIKDDLKDGVCNIYHPNGKLKATAYFEKGKMQRFNKFYHENGNLFIDMPVKDAKMDGVVKVYKKNGKPNSELVYKDDKMISGKCADGRKIPSTMFVSDIEYISRLCDNPEFLF